MRPLLSSVHASLLASLCFLYACQTVVVEVPDASSDLDAGADGGIVLASSTQALETSLCGSIAGLQANAVWPMRGGCPTHAAQSSEYGSETNVRNWATPVSNYMIGGAAIAADGTIYIGTYGGQLYKLHGTTGAILQTLNTGGSCAARRPSPQTARSTSGPTQASWSRSIRAPLRSSGAMRAAIAWAHRLRWHLTAPSTSRQKTITCTRSTRTAHSSGATRPQRACKLAGYRARRHGVRGGLDWFVYALNPATGAMKWRVGLDWAIQHHPVLGRFGRLYISAAGTLYAIDTSNGTIAWKKEIGTDSAKSASVAANGVVYVGTGTTATGGAGSFQALTADGETLWKLEGIGHVESAPTVDRAGNIFFGANDGYLYAVDPTGRVLWKYLTGGKVHTQPAIQKGGAIIFGSFDNKVYSVGTGRGRAPAGGVCTAMRCATRAWSG